MALYISVKHVADEGLKCQECGAWVVEREIHDEFHDWLDSIEESAAKAYGKAVSAEMYHRPLG